MSIQPIEKTQPICFFNEIKLHDYGIADVMHVIFSGSLLARSYIVTPNVDHFSRLDRVTDERFNKAYFSADLAVCDSRIVRLISILEPYPIKRICPGSDLTECLLTSEEIKGKRILVIGSQPELVNQLSLKYGLSSVECHSPPMAFLNNPKEFQKCLEFILSSTAQIVFLALGSPQQEILAHAVKCDKEIGKKFNGIMLCVGASLDFLTGVSNRAPIIVQMLHLEWLHRALTNPARLAPRYWENLKWVICYVIKRIFS